MSYLLSAGCSFTEGEELTDPKTQAWPHVLGNMLDLPVVNKGLRGSGVEYATKSIIKNVEQEKPKLVIAAFPQSGRREWKDNYGFFNVWPGCHKNNWWTRQTEPLKDRTMVVDWFTRNSDDYYLQKDFLRKVILLQSYLKQKKVKYIFFNVYGHADLNYEYRLLEDFVLLTNALDKDYYIDYKNDSFVEWMDDCPKGPGGHPLELGHERVAKKLYEIIDIKQLHRKQR